MWLEVLHALGTASTVQLRQSPICTTDAGGAQPATTGKGLSTLCPHSAHPSTLLLSASVEPARVNKYLKKTWKAAGKLAGQFTLITSLTAQNPLH